MTNAIDRLKREGQSLRDRAVAVKHKLALHPDSKPSIGLVSEVEDLIEDTEALRAQVRSSDG